MATREVQLKGEFFWVMLRYLEPGQNSTYEVENTAKWSINIQTSAVREDVQKTIRALKGDWGYKSTAGGTFKLVSASVEGNLSMSASINQELSSLNKFESKSSLEKSGEFKWKAKSEKGDKIFVNQLGFRWPGATFLTETYYVGIKSASQLEEERTGMGTPKMKWMVKPIKFLKRLQVKYGRDAFEEPDNTVKEIDNESNDINHGQSSVWVWLVPDWVDVSSDACTSISIIITKTEDKNRDDLAKGDFEYSIADRVRQYTPNWRYLKDHKDSDISEKITNIWLLRRSECVTFKQVQEMGYNGMSIDINKDRKGDFLYLVWKTTPTELAVEV